MKHRIAPIAILLLASFLYDALGLFLAVGTMTAAPMLANGPLEAVAIGQALPSDSAQPPVPLPAKPDLIFGPVLEMDLDPLPDLPPPVLTSAIALTRDAVMAVDTTQTCHSVPLPGEPTAAYQVATGLERIIAHGTTELTGLDATMASALILDDTSAAFAQQSGAARLTGILPEVVDPPG